MSVNDLSDTEFLLALCIREEELEDPATWCKEMRQLNRDIHAGPKTSDEAHALMARGDRLAKAIHRKPPTSDEPY